MIFRRGVTFMATMLYQFTVLGFAADNQLSDEPTGFFWKNSRRTMCQQSQKETNPQCMPHLPVSLVPSLFFARRMNVVSSLVPRPHMWARSHTRYYTRSPRSISSSSTSACSAHTWWQMQVWTTSHGEWSDTTTSYTVFPTSKQPEIHSKLVYFVLFFHSAWVYIRRFFGLLQTMTCYGR